MNVIYLNKKNVLIFLAGALIMMSAFLWPRPVQATPPDGLGVESIASATLQEAIRVKFKEGDDGFGIGTDVKNIVMVKYTVAPGGTFGWHVHGGPVWAVVKSGALSVYEADDPTCTPEVYEAGVGFLDPGDRIHMGRNETSEPTIIYVTFMLPEGGLTRLDGGDPGICNQ